MLYDVLCFQKHGLDKLLASHGYFNLLAPVNAALNRLQPQSRKVITEHFSIECCKTKPKVITAANQNKGNITRSQ